MMLIATKMADVDGFCIVKSKKSRKYHQKTKQKTSSKLIIKEDDSFNLEDFKKRLDNCIEEISRTDFFTNSSLSILNAVSSVSQRTPRPGGRVSAGDVLQNHSHHSQNLTDIQTDSWCPICNTSETCHQLCHVPGAAQTGCLNHECVSPPERLSLSDHEPPDVDMLSYGIGSFVTGVIARYQLAFFLALRGKLGERCTNCYVYDPVFSSQEKRVLELYNCQVISENEEGKRECTKPTVAFLPHCGKALYNNLLWRNLATDTSEGLSHLVLIGNSFSNILERTPRRTLNRTGSYLLQLSPYITEVHLANTFVHADVFNDLSVHYFSYSQLMKARSHVGEHCSEPVYQEDDAEFIAK